MTFSFQEIATAIRDSARTSIYKNGRTCSSTNYSARHWHIRQQEKYEAHPVVVAMLAEYQPEGMAELVLQWPHVAEKDPTRLAYTQSEEKGAKDIQTVTSIGKYVARHWPHVTEHLRREKCAAFTPDRLEIWTTLDQIIQAVQEGPKSCMQDDFEVHPYSVYLPELGWSVAVRFGVSGTIDGRALLWTDPEDSTRKMFVRTYRRSTDPCNSQADDVLSGWLKQAGYTCKSGWPIGAELDRIEIGDNFVAPYLDGENQGVRDAGETLVICCSDSTEYSCDNTDGTTLSSPWTTCTDCGSGIAEHNEDYIYIGRNSDAIVCSCCSDNYINVTDARGYEYYVYRSDAIEVSGTYYDENNLPSNIRRLEDGDYFDTDEEDYCEIDGEYYLCDDRRVVCCEDSEYRFKDDCWYCAESGEWYSDDDENVKIDGSTYHPDSDTAVKFFKEEEEI